MRRPVRKSLIDVLIPHTRQGVLSATLLRPTRSWYLADLARHLRVRPSSLQRELAMLTDVGILKSHRQGRMVYFQADTDCPVYPELQGLLTKTAGLVDVLRNALNSLTNRITTCFVYGSIARHDETTASDVDLLLVGQLGLADIALPLRRAQESIGREINPKLYRPEEFAKRLAANDHFLKSILKKPKLFVIGTERDLKQLWNQGKVFRERPRPPNN